MSHISQHLQSDRMIKLFIGEARECFQVPQSTLEHASDYFRTALRNEHLGQDAPGTLSFPKDDITAWRVLLHWITRHELPSREDLIPKLDEPVPNPAGTGYPIRRDFNIAVRAWALGEKYLMPGLQDSVMLEMLDVLDGEVMCFSTIKEGIGSTPPNCKLRLLLAEELVMNIGWEGSRLEILEQFDHVAGLTSTLGKVMDRQLQYAKGHGGEVGEEVFVPRLRKNLADPEDDEEVWERWKEYMVAGGPSRHWIHDPVEMAE